jgi:uncharacterized membrane protein
MERPMVLQTAAHIEIAPSIIESRECITENPKSGYGMGYLNTIQRTKTRIKTRTKTLYNRTFALAALAALTLSVSRTAIAQSRYTITDLGTLPGYTSDNYFEWQSTINNLGHVAAYANDVDPANPNGFSGDVSFIWDGPNKKTLLPGLPGSTDTIVFNLNDFDQSVGISTLAGIQVACQWSTDGKVKSLPSLPGDTGSGSLVINNFGTSVGFSGIPGSAALNAVKWENGHAIALPPLPGMVYSQGISINDSGVAVGYSGPNGGQFDAVAWFDDHVIDLGTLGGSISFPYAINDFDVVVGQSNTSLTNFDSFVPVVWRDGKIINLGNFGSDAYGLALGVNFWGQIVGASGPSVFDALTAHALLWENGKIINLQDQIPANSGWVLLAAVGINDCGQIDGFGVHNGEYRDFILTPR